MMQIYPVQSKCFKNNCMQIEYYTIIEYYAIIEYYTIIEWYTS